MVNVAIRPRTELSLCAGYGGLGIGVALTCPGIRLVGAVERQAYAAAVLADRMDEGAVDSAPIYDDLESFPCELYRGRVDLVSAGFPCQGASVAGKRLGIEDERWLWPEVWRITREVGASWLFAENVTGLLSVNGGRAFEEIVRDLGASGWAAEWDCVPAGAVGAPHLRDRLFLLASNPDRVAVRVEPKRDQRRGRGERKTKRGSAEPRVGGKERDAADANRLRHEAGALGSGGWSQTSPWPVAPSANLTGDAADPARAERTTGRRPEQLEVGTDANRAGEKATDADGKRRRRARKHDVHAGERDAVGGGEAAAHATRERRDQGLAIDPGARRQGGANAPGSDQPVARAGHAADADDAGLSRLRHSGEPLGLDGAETHWRDADGRGGEGPGDLDRILADGRAHWDWSLAPEPCVRGLDDGPSDGMGDDPAYADKLHLLGNGVVPYQAAVAFAILWERLHGTALDVEREG